MFGWGSWFDIIFLILSIFMIPSIIPYVLSSSSPTLFILITLTIESGYYKIFFISLTVQYISLYLYIEYDNANSGNAIENYWNSKGTYCFETFLKTIIITLLGNVRPKSLQKLINSPFSILCWSDYWLNWMPIFRCYRE